MRNRKSVGRLGMGIALLGLIFGAGCATGPDDIPCPEGTVRSGDVCVVLGEESSKPEGTATGENGSGDAGLSNGGPEGPLPTDPLPFQVDAVYAPSGYMGDAVNSVTTSSECPKGSDPCHQFVYELPSVSEGFGGVFWQYPANNWGEQPGFDMPLGADVVRFRAWGGEGGETVEFLAGMDGVDPFSASIVVTLTAEPVTYEIELPSTEYTTITGAFAWSMVTPDERTEFFVDSIVWDMAEEARTPGKDSGGAPEEDARVAQEDAGSEVSAFPVVVDEHYSASGYMGAGETPGGIETAEVCADPRPGSASGMCHQFKLDPSIADWGGVYWQYPENNWSLPGYVMPAGATHVSAYAWGEAGGGSVSFVVGINAADGFEIKTAPVILTPEPQHILIPLEGVAYTTVAGGFAWVAENVAAPLTLYLDDIQWIVLEERTPETEEGTDASAEDTDAAAEGGSDGSRSVGGESSPEEDSDGEYGEGFPFVVDEVYAPSGYMGAGSQPGNIEDLEVCADPRPGAGLGICHKVTMKGKVGWGGVYWQYPENNWGDQPGYAIPKGATGVSFFAWGESGGESVEFLVGMSDPDGFEKKLGPVILGAEPQEYTLSLDAVSYNEVVGGFGWVMEESTSDRTFYIDNLHWTDQ